MKYRKCAFLLVFFVKIVSSEVSYGSVLSYIDTTTIENLSEQCKNDLDKLTFMNATLWLMADSSSRLPSGVARGNIIAMGNYDECLDIKEIDTKFCHASFTPKFFPPPETHILDTKRINTELFGVPQSSNLSIGFYYCVLKSCSAKELNIIYNGFVQFDDNECISKDSKPDLDAAAISAIFIFAIIALITVISTIYDIYLRFSSSPVIHPALIAFSVYANGKKLFHLGNSNQLQCLNGLKAISMLWVVLGHVYMAYVFVPLDNYVEVYKWLESIRSQYITGATVSVDTFFVIAGFLTVYTFMNSVEKITKFNILASYLHRYLRLTPALAAIILAHAALYNYFGSGPIWQNTNTYLVKACREYWWSALFYVQNYANPERICVPQSWYLSVDMQLFLISPPLLILIRRWPLWGYIFLAATSILSITASFLIGWYFKLGGQITANLNGNLRDYMKYYYMPTHTRMVPYLFGIMLGHAVYKWKNSEQKLKFNKIFVILGWAWALVLMAVCLYGGHSLQTFKYDQLANSFYISLMRPAWALAICWIIFACVLGYGGLINKFLSLPIFQILSRLCYSIYLVHYSFIFLIIFSIRSPLHFSEYSAFHKFWGDFAFTLAIAILWSLIFESPIVVLEKILLNKAKARRETFSSKV